MAMLNEAYLPTTESLVTKLLVSSTDMSHKQQWHSLSLFGFVLRQANVLNVLEDVWSIAQQSALRLEWGLSVDAFVFLALQLSRYFQGRESFSGLPEKQMIFDLIKHHYIDIKARKTASKGQKLVLFLSTAIDFPWAYFNADIVYVNFTTQLIYDDLDLCPCDSGIIFEECCRPRHS